MPYFGQHDLMYSLKLFLQKVSLLQLLFDRLFECDNETNKYYVDNDANDSTITNNNDNSEHNVQSSKYLNTLACLRYYRNLSLKKASLTQFLFDRLNDFIQKTYYIDDDANNSRVAITSPGFDQQQQHP